jgi:heptosyltransferase-2
MKMNFYKARKILIVRLSSLGDVLLTLPVLGALKREFPEKNFSFVVNKQYSDAVKFHPALNSIFEYDRDNPETTIEKLLAEKFDFVIDLQNNRRSSKIVKSLGAPARVFKKPDLKKFLLVHFKLNLFDEIKSVPELYASAAEPALKVNYDDFEFFLPERKAKHVPEKKKICFCPGAQHFTKRYPTNYFTELGRMLQRDGFEIHLLGGKADKEICGEISAALSGAKNKNTDDDLFALAREFETCAVAVCNDSGLMHLASAVGTPVIALFGSSVREFGFAPFSRKSLLLENNSLSCRPCSHVGRPKCPKEHFKCMLELKPKYVYEKFTEFYKANV